MHDRYDPRILFRKDDAVLFASGEAYAKQKQSANTAGCLASVGNHPVSEMLDRLVASVNDIEEVIRIHGERIEPALTPIAEPIGPADNNKDPRACTSPLVDSMRGQCERLASLSNHLRRLTDRVEL